MIHVYAFVDGLERLPERLGVDGAALEAVQAGRVGVVVSRHDRAPASGDRRAGAAAHGLVVEALSASAASVLPVRFGEELPGDGELHDAVRAREQAILEALELVRGCVELGVRLAAAAAPVAAQSGRAYLEGRLAETSMLVALDERLRPFTRASATSVGERAYLVERGAASVALDAARAFAAAYPELSLVCTGPWAPYSFCEVPA